LGGRFCSGGALNETTPDFRLNPHGTIGIFLLLSQNNQNEKSVPIFFRHAISFFCFYSVISALSIIGLTTIFQISVDTAFSGISSGSGILIMM